MIVAPAVKDAFGKVWSAPAPSNHGVVFAVMAADCKWKLNDKSDPEGEARFNALIRPHDMGFITDTGEYLGRRDAWLHCVACKQAMFYWPEDRIAKHMGPEDKAGLTSEDLWVLPGQVRDPVEP
jgi:hypothetical protein